MGLTPLQQRIVNALEASPARRLDWHSLAKAIWPPEQHPRAWNYSNNGGPCGWSMNLSRAVSQLQEKGIVSDRWDGPGRRQVILRNVGIGGVSGQQGLPAG